MRHPLRQLEAILGTTVIADYSDDHTRWGLYRTAINAPEALPTLLRAVSVEQDASLASGVVGEVLERIDPQARPAWVQALDPSVREFSARRTRELHVLESIRSGTFPATQVADVIDEWSNWLQLRIATDVSDKVINQALSERGRTKRIRNTARNSLR